MQGWPLLGTLTAGLLLMAAAVLMLGPDAEGVRQLIRVTARSSCVLFLLAFTASVAARRWPGSLTRWQLANRRQIGLGFAVSHTIHAAAIAAHVDLALEAPGQLGQLGGSTCVETQLVVDGERGLDHSSGDKGGVTTTPLTEPCTARRASSVKGFWLA